METGWSKPLDIPERPRQNEETGSIRVTAAGASPAGLHVRTVRRPAPPAAAALPRIPPASASALRWLADLGCDHGGPDGRAGDLVGQCGGNLYPRSPGSASAPGERRSYRQR